EGMAGRVSRTLENSIAAMALFAPAVLILAVQQAFTPATLLAAQIFIVARILYVPIYAFGIAIPFLRTLVWMVGFLASVFLLFVAI
ncbi:MAG: MAPEG family protein, partial [Pseudomonadota bacterium]